MEGCQGASGAGEWGEREGETRRNGGGGGGDGGGAGECVCSSLMWVRCVCVCVQKEARVRCFARCSAVRTRVLATMHAFACMSMLMSTRSRGQTLTHK